MVEEMKVIITKKLGEEIKFEIPKTESSELFKVKIGKFGNGIVIELIRCNPVVLGLL